MLINDKYVEKKSRRAPLCFHAQRKSLKKTSMSIRTEFLPFRGKVWSSQKGIANMNEADDALQQQHLHTN